MHQFQAQASSRVLYAFCRLHEVSRCCGLKGAGDWSTQYSAPRCVMSDSTAPYAYAASWTDQVLRGTARSLHPRMLNLAPVPLLSLNEHMQRLPLVRSDSLLCRLTSAVTCCRVLCASLCETLCSQQS